MKRSIAILATLLCISLTTAFSQEGIVSVHPANNPSGKMLTMEETILSRELYPKSYYTRFQGNDSLIFNSPDGYKAMVLKSGKTTPYLRKPTAPSRPAYGMPALVKGNSRWSAFSDKGSLYAASESGDTTAIAISEKDGIVYGDIVSRNEFGINGGIFFSPDGNKLAFYRKDETRVTLFPLLDITTRTGSLKQIRYPMAGMDSEQISLGIYDFNSGKTSWAEVTDFDCERYLTNISWSEDSQHIYIQVLDRSQKHMRLNMYNAEDGSFEKNILTEDNDKYVEPLDPLHPLKGTDKLIYRTDNRDGYKNLYLIDNGGNVQRLTCCDADVEYLCNDGRNVYYMSYEVSPVESHLFKTDTKTGRTLRLTWEEGTHNVWFSDNCKWFVDCWNSLNNPGTAMVRSTDGKISRPLWQADDPTSEYAFTEIDLGTVKSADGKYDNWYRLIKPLDFDPSKKYPVVIYVYGGPHSQMVTNSWLGLLRRWEMYMAQRGYLVYVQDNRGTSNRGAEFEKAIHCQCGQAEMADQMEGVKMLKSLPYVDCDRIGVHGWSYGGFMTISLMTNYPETFKVGVAGGPVIDWKWYEVMYGERYMETPQSNPEGFAKTSLLAKAKVLKGKLLICQGAVDPTVVWEHSLSFIRECIKNNVQVDYFPYPCAEHNVMGKDRVHLMDKVSMYFDDYL